MKPYLLLLSGLLGGANPGLFGSGIDATATYTDSLVAPGVFQYDLTLNNTGTTKIGAFWFSWVPGAGFMSVTPTDVASPTGWKDTVTNGGASILWTAPTADRLAAGDSISGFEFDSTLTPAELQMDFTGSGIGSGDPVTTSFVYVGIPLLSRGDKIVASPAVASTPEPTTTLSAALGFGLIVFSSHLLRRRKKFQEL